MNLLQMSISAGLLVIAIVLIRAVALNRLPKTAFLILWCAALFRLLVPVVIPARFSFYSAFRGIISSLTLPGGAIPMVTENAAPMGETVIWGIFPVDGVTQEQVFSLPMATIIWLVGMAALFIFFAVIYFKNHQRLRFATLIRDNDFLDEWLASNRQLRPIAIMQSDRIISPIAVGILKPRIILPKCMDMTNHQLLSHVLTHEYYHIRRFDAVWKILLVCAVCIHWFNPLVWIMFVLASRDLELTCDEMVIRRLGAEQKAAYAYAIISMAELRSSYASLYNGFSKNAAKERIESIMKMKRKSIVSLVITCAMIVTLTVGTLTAFATEGQYDERTLQPFPAGRDFHLENYEELYEWLEKLLQEEQEDGLRLFPRRRFEEGFRFESLEALREFLGEDVSITFVPWYEQPDLENIGCWEELLADLGIERRIVDRADALSFDDFRLLPRHAEGLRRFESLDAIREYFGAEEVNFFPANVPLLPHIYGMETFIIHWLGERIDILADAELYAMIQDGATLSQIMNAIAAR